MWENPFASFKGKYCMDKIYATKEKQRLLGKGAS